MLSVLPRLFSRLACHENVKQPGVQSQAVSQEQQRLIGASPRGGRSTVHSGNRQGEATGLKPTTVTSTASPSVAGSTTCGARPSSPAVAGAASRRGYRLEHDRGDGRAEQGGVSTTWTPGGSSPPMAIRPTSPAAFGDEVRAAQVRRLIDGSQASRGITYLFGMGLFSWGYDQIIRADPAVRGKNKAGQPLDHVMCGATEKAWSYVEKILDTALVEVSTSAGSISSRPTWAGAIALPAGGSTAPSATTARLNIRAADYIKRKWPGKLVTCIPDQLAGGLGPEPFRSSRARPDHRAQQAHRLLHGPGLERHFHRGRPAEGIHQETALRLWNVGGALGVSLWPVGPAILFPAASEAYRPPRSGAITRMVLEAACSTRGR